MKGTWKQKEMQENDRKAQGNKKQSKEHERKLVPKQSKTYGLQSRKNAGQSLGLLEAHWIHRTLAGWDPYSAQKMAVKFELEQKMAAKDMNTVNEIK